MKAKAQGPPPVQQAPRADIRIDRYGNEIVSRKIRLEKNNGAKTLHKLTFVD